jgi:hypothetical protein
MICIRVKEGHCPGTGCPQGVPHEKDQFCDKGFCRQSPEMTYCVAESKRERLERYLVGLLPGTDKSDISDIAFTIDEIYMEE